MPGHAQAAIAAYPELGWHRDAARSGLAGLGRAQLPAQRRRATFAFIDNVLDEVVALFPGAVHPYRRRRGGQGSMGGIAARAGAACARLASTRGRAAGLVRPAHRADPRSARPTLVGWDEILEGGSAARCVYVMARRRGAVDAAAGPRRRDVAVAATCISILPPERSARTSRRDGRRTLAARTLCVRTGASDAVRRGQPHTSSACRPTHGRNTCVLVRAGRARAVPPHRRGGGNRLVAEGSQGLRRISSHACRRNSNATVRSASITHRRLSAVVMDAHPDGRPHRVRVALSNPVSLGDIHYTTDVRRPAPASPTYRPSHSRFRCPSNCVPRPFVDGKPLADPIAALASTL